MSELKTDEKAPRSDLSSSIGKEVTLFLREPAKFAPLKFTSQEDGGVTGRLVGADRMGLWFEPQSLREAALAGAGPVPHVFLSWEDVLALVRYNAAEEFNSKKEYRGLRPAL